MIEFLRKSIIYGYCVPLKLSRNEKNNIWRNHYRHRLKKYLRIESTYDGDITRNESHIIFTSWLQGYDVAPPIVQKCLDSIKQFSGSNTVINITKKNLKEYVDIPSIIINKWKLGQISNAHFSDLLRVALLDKYGGIWIDATVMLFAPIPEYITESSLFFYQSSFLESEDPGISNWLIGSKYAGNLFVHALHVTLINYWQQNSIVEDYYLFHDFAILLAQQDMLRDEWNRIPYFNNVNPHTLQRELYEKFDYNRLSMIIEMSPVQKLTYKFNQRENINYNTFLNYLLNGEAGI